MAPQLQAKLEKSPRPVWLPWPRSERGHHSFDQSCATRPWISAIMPGGHHHFSQHKMAKGPSVINDIDICKKTKMRRLGEGSLGQVRFLKNYRCAAGTKCAVLSSRLVAQHFCQSSMRRNVVRFIRSTFVKFRCTYATHNALQHYHS